MQIVFQVRIDKHRCNQTVVKSLTSEIKMY